ncbi:hypothetical protein [Microbacterium jejuense]|uniref:hypothetical protein n=1 Tax=Microbacterium jejuense TaxID=1263637 RepID=UPI0031F17F73
MTTIEQPFAATASADQTDTARPTRGLAFWVVRYVPAELAGTAAMVIAGLLATMWTDVPALIALAALIGEIIGFYALLAVTVYLEQVQVTSTWRQAAGRTALLLVAEFGAAELLDTLLIRPAALLVGVWLIPDPLWGMLAGKIAADIVFYAMAAGAFTLTARTGLRDGSRRARPSA